MECLAGRTARERAMIWRSLDTLETWRPQDSSRPGCLFEKPRQLSGCESGSYVASGKEVAAGRKCVGRVAHAAHAASSIRVRARRAVRWLRRGTGALSRPTGIGSPCGSRSAISLHASSFALLEQLLPGGPDPNDVPPFAQSLRRADGRAPLGPRADAPPRCRARCTLRKIRLKHGPRAISANFPGVLASGASGDVEQTEAGSGSQRVNWGCDKRLVF